jgi:PilZ domain-containing protein
METAYNFDGYRRLAERRNYKKEVSFSMDLMIFPAVLNDLSIGGASVSTISLQKIKPGVKIIITIPFANKPGCIKRKAIVKWAKKDKFGIEFT